uniref:Follicular dendritic cell secreted peptide n=1 Tax=Tarentola mauritanica TaxID=8569 RepID=A0A0K1HRY2_TARMA|nr:follicular dendritic cell secreted peptide [Tarentola mauritanica]
MKTLLVLACLLALVVPFQASSSGSHSNERRYFGKYHRPVSRPWPPYPYYPNAFYRYPYYLYPPTRVGPLAYFGQPGSPYMYMYVLPAPVVTPAPATTTTTIPATTTTAKTTTTTGASTTP